jgi:hypothetical protein
VLTCGEIPQKMRGNPAPKPNAALNASLSSHLRPHGRGQNDVRDDKGNQQLHGLSVALVLARASHAIVGSDCEPAHMRCSQKIGRDERGSRLAAQEDLTRTYARSRICSNISFTPMAACLGTQTKARGLGTAGRYPTSDLHYRGRDCTPLNSAR